MQWEKLLHSDYLTDIEIASTGKSVWVLGSSYIASEGNYFPKLHGVSESGEDLLTYTFVEYSGYYGLTDFTTSDGNSFYLEGSLTNSTFRTDELTARWDNVTEKIASPQPINNAYIYPNPCTEYANVYSGNDINTISIVDVSGKIIARYSNVADEFQITTASWASGIYLVTVSNNEGQKTIKLIKE